MQRPRKRRAYISVEQRMVYEPFLIVDDGGWICYETTHDFRERNWHMCIPMDWAGFEDQSGNDVYEGDLYKRYNYLYVVANTVEGFKGVVVARKNVATGKFEPIEADGRYYQISLDDITEFVGNYFQGWIGLKQ